MDTKSYVEKLAEDKAKSQKNKGKKAANGKHSQKLPGKK